MADVVSMQPFGNQMIVNMSDGSKLTAYPTVGSLWIVKGSTGTPPVDPPTSDLYNPYGSLSFEGGWENHASYSRGGSDFPYGMGTAVLAPAAGTISNQGWTDAAGRKAMLTFTTEYVRKVAPSGTLMNGVYTESVGPMRALMIQHLSAWVPDGPVAKGAVIGYSGASANPIDGEIGGDIHLHVHGLETPFIGGNRLDFMKFV